MSQFGGRAKITAIHSLQKGHKDEDRICLLESWKSQYT